MTSESGLWTLKCRPEIDFVPIKARRLCNVEVVARNQACEMANADLVARYGCLIPDGNDPPESFSPTEVLLWGERYGGWGIGSHGGGVRCGIDFSGGVKGIGCNSLVGADAPPDYRHGGMSLAECLIEFVWSEVFSVALPFGSVRVEAVLSTGTTCWWVERRWARALLEERYGESVYLPRGLTVREHAVRPAHFDRALFFKPAHGGFYNAQSDVARVKAALAMLPGILPTPTNDVFGDGVAPTSHSPIERGLDEFVRRLAAQSAAAKCKRLIHGSIAASNVAMDGKWLDFGASTALPHWGPIKGHGDFWDDADIYERLLSPLYFHLNKQATSKPAHGICIESAMTRFKEVHERHVAARLLAFSGVPLDVCARMLDTSSGRALIQVISRAIRHGHRKPYDGYPDEHSEFGTYAISALILEARRGDNGSDVEGKIAHNDPVIEGLHAALWRFDDDAFSRHGHQTVSRGEWLALCCDNVERSNNVITKLFRPRLVEAIEGLLRDHNDTQHQIIAFETLLADIMVDVRASLVDRTGMYKVALTMGQFDGVRP